MSNKLLAKYPKRHHLGPLFGPKSYSNLKSDDLRETEFGLGDTWVCKVSGHQKASENHLWPHMLSYLQKQLEKVGSWRVGGWTGVNAESILILKRLFP